MRDMMKRRANIRRVLNLGIAIQIWLSPLSYAEIIAPDRRIDWSQAGVTGSIPNRTTICATLNPGATAAQINTAIQNCSAGQVVFLNAGTYNLSSGIDFNGKNDITLRGAGPDQTLLKFTGSSPCRGMGADICVGPADSDGISYYVEYPAHIADWTSGFAKGTTQITLSNTTGLVAGMVIVLDQLDDANTDNGAVWVCQTAGVCVDEGPGGAGRANRAQTQMVKVTAINGLSVTITPGLYMQNWRASQSPQAFWGNRTGFAFGMGVEGVTVDNSNNQSGNRSDIYLIWCNGCWVKNVKDVNSDRNHVWLYQTTHSTVRDSYFYGTKNAASQSYGVESYMGSDNLVENNIFQHITAPLMTGGSTEGTVYGYNYAIDDYYNVSPNWMQGSNYFHAAGNSMVLNEGNDGINVSADNIHGTQHFVTVFRNYFAGWESGKTAQTVAINLYSFNRYFNIVGNVLGAPGYHKSYESIPPSFTNPDTSIYRLGDPGNLPAAKTDALVKTTLLRWGNYDTVANAVKWDSSEVPSGLSQYANPVPSDHNLPASLYLSAKPGWWPASIPWPPIGPDVTGGNVSGVGGHVYKIPAHLCYDNTPKDSNGILLFNANNCYGDSGDAPPSSPRNLRIR